MDLRVLSLFMATYIPPLIDCWCYHFNPLTVDFDGLCLKWWDDAQRYTKDASIKRCVKLIKRKCPCMIAVEPEISRHYDGESQRYEHRAERVTATLGGDPNSWVYYKEYKLTPICSDENGEVDCDHWWMVAKMPQAGDKVKEICINRILHHCKGMITKLGETSTCRVRGQWRSYDVKQVEYQHEEGDTATFNRYDPVK